MRARIGILVLVLAGCGSGLCAEDKFYKWTDESGTVHYSAKPPEQGNADTVSVRSEKANDPEAPATDGADAPAEPVAVDQDEVMKKMLAMEAELCLRARNSLAILEHGRSISSLSTSTGASKPLVGAEREKAMVQARAQVEQFCSPPAVATQQE